MLKITSKDIQDWTKKHKKDAEKYLPELIRRLICDTCKTNNIHIPSGDSISTGGYDGMVTITEENPFLPIGDCVIEFGTDDAIRGKADDDFIKRTKSPKCNPTETNFIFVTSRLFSKSVEWQDSKNKEGGWKLVKAINADDLEAWLDNSPSVSIWFAEIANLWPSGMLSISGAWENFRLYINKSISKSLILLDRDEQIASLLSALEKGGQKIEIQSDSKLESFGFILASLKDNPNFGSRVIVLNNQDQWNYLVQASENRILVPAKSFMPDEIGSALSRGHSIIISSGKDRFTGISFNIKIPLPRMYRESRIKGLIDIVKDKEIAQEIYSDTKGYFYPILRHVKLDPNENYAPTWLSKFDIHFLFSVLFLTEWEEGRDEELVSACFSEDYKKIQDKLLALSKMEDSPIRRIGNVWQVISKDDLWAILGQKFDSSLLERVESIVQTALTDNDTSSDLPKEDRWLANIHGKGPTYSPRIKQGISNSLALLSTMGDSGISDAINGMIRMIFNATKTPYKILYDLRGNIQNIAEASPKIFLEFIEKNIDEIDELFESKGDFFTSRNEYVHLLWALEIVAWSPDYLPAVTTILIKLSEKYEANIRENYSNRPKGSLSGIYLFWQRGTSESMEGKLDILTQFSKKYPQFIFDLIIDTLNTTTFSSTATPIYRNWSNLLGAITNKEFHDYGIGAIKIATTIFKELPETTFVPILENINSFPKDIQTEILDTLLSIDYSNFQNQSLINARKEIEGLISGDVLYQRKLHVDKDKLLEIYDLLVPTDILSQYGDLFSNSTKFIISESSKYKGSDWEVQEAIVNKERIKVVEDIFEAHGFAGIKGIIIQNNPPIFLIDAILNSSISGKIYNEFYGLLGESNPVLFVFGINILNVLFRRNEDYEKESLVLLDRDESDEIKGRFLLSLSKSKIKFSILREQNEDVQNVFWSSIGDLNWWNILGEKEYSEANYVIAELNSRGMCNISFHLIEILSHDGSLNLIDVENIFFTLEKLVVFINNGGLIQSIDYVIRKILEYLYNLEEKGLVDKNKIASLEIQYVKAIDSPKILNRELSESPSLFVDLIIKMYRKRSEEHKTPTEDEKRVAGNVYHILSKFHIIPGTDSSGEIDKTKLTNYIDETMKLLKECDRYEFGSQKIGEILSYAPVGKDGIWPCEAIRDIIDKQKNDNINKGFYIGKRNQRGTTTRSPFEGGNQEREIAEKYRAWANALKVTHRITSKILLDMSEEYMREAKREDEMVDIST